MVHPITKNINIQVVPKFEEIHSAFNQINYLFSYQISIFNGNKVPIRLIRRHWEVNDFLYNMKIVDGEGVVGKTPIIEPFQTFSYASAVTIPTEIGQMSGHYTFLDLHQLIEFDVSIPTFQLVFPPKYN